MFEVRGLEFEVEGNQIQLFDVFGREVLRKAVIAEKTVFDLRGMPDGIYFYKVEMDEKLLSGKIIVQK